MAGVLAGSLVVDLHLPSFGWWDQGQLTGYSYPRPPIENLLVKEIPDLVDALSTYPVEVEWLHVWHLTKHAKRRI